MTTKEYVVTAAVVTAIAGVYMLNTNGSENEE
jgi:hypothetical protein